MKSRHCQEIDPFSEWPKGKQGERHAELAFLSRKFIVFTLPLGPKICGGAGFWLPQPSCGAKKKTPRNFWRAQFVRRKTVHNAGDFRFGGVKNPQKRSCLEGARNRAPSLHYDVSASFGRHFFQPGKEYYLFLLQEGFLAWKLVPILVLFLLCLCGIHGTPSLI